jgi:hypothetical protein
MDLTEDGTKQTESAIRMEQENVDGFVDIQQQKKKNMESLTKALSEYDRMKTVDDKCICSEHERELITLHN